MKITAPFDVQMRRSVFAPFLALLGGAWLAGCAGQPSAKGAWQPNAPRNQSYHRILVVGLSKDYNQRCAFEHSLVSQLNSGSIISAPSCDFIKSEDPLTRPNIEKAVASINADAVLTSKVVDEGFEAKEGAGRDDRGGGYYKATDVAYATSYYGGYGVAVVSVDFVESSSITTLQGKVHLLTRLYETGNESLVYTINTKAADLESRQDALLEITPPIADRLRRAGLVR